MQSQRTRDWSHDVSSDDDAKAAKKKWTAKRITKYLSPNAFNDGALETGKPETVTTAEGSRLSASALGSRGLSQLSTFSLQLSASALSALNLRGLSQMGGAASTEAPPEARPQKKVKPTREQATVNSMHLAADILGHGVEAPKITINGGKPFKGFLWGDGDGLKCGRQKFGKVAARIQWRDAGVHFKSKNDMLYIYSETAKWDVHVEKRPNIAAWLGCYLHAFLPVNHVPLNEANELREYTVTFTEWGRLGIAFAVYCDVVIPVVFTVDTPASTFGVEPSSVLMSLNGTKISDLPKDANMLDFITNANFPKICVFARLANASNRLKLKYPSNNASPPAATVGSLDITRYASPKNGPPVNSDPPVSDDPPPDKDDDDDKAVDHDDEMAVVPRTDPETQEDEQSVGEATVMK